MEADGLRRLIAFGLAGLSILWGILLVVGAFTAPAYRHELAGHPSYTTTLTEEHGDWIAVLAAVPALTAVVVALMLYRRFAIGSADAEIVAWAGIALLFVVSVFTLTTIGIYILPEALFLAGSAVLIRRLAARPGR